jgi:hypothetical protein
LEVVPVKSRAEDYPRFMATMTAAFDRLKAGEKVYGPFDPAADRRDLLREAEDELLDAIVYAYLAILKLSLRTGLRTATEHPHEGYHLILVPLPGDPPPERAAASRPESAPAKLPPPMRLGRGGTLGTDPETPWGLCARFGRWPVTFDPGAFGAFPLRSLESRAAARALLDQRESSKFRCEITRVSTPGSQMVTYRIRLENVLRCEITRVSTPGSQMVTYRIRLENVPRCEITRVSTPGSQMVTYRIRLENVPDKTGNRRRQD